MSVFDPNTLLDLVDDESGHPFALDLARTYQRLLGQRVSRIVTAVGEAPHVDLVDSLDAVLSLKVSSAMTGLEDVAAVARSIEQSIRTGDLGTAQEETARLPRVAACADRALSDYLATAAQPLSDSMR